MKTFYKSSELPHLWAHGLVDSARCPSAESIQGDAYRSYGTDIGRRYSHGGKSCFIVNETSYSVTTSGHQSAMRGAIPHDAIVFHVGHVRMGDSLQFGTHKQTGARLFDYAMEQAKECAVRAEKAKGRKQELLDRKGSWMIKAHEVSEFFGLRRKVDEKTIQRFKEAQLRENARLAKQAKEREAQRVIEQREEIAAWMRGESVHLSYSLPCYLRTERPVDADPARSCVLEIVTSKGARISYDAGKRTFEFAMKMRAKGWHKNGDKFSIDSYQLDAVNEQGIICGCHRISFEEIERFAKSEGWIS